MLLFSSSVTSNSLWPHGLQHASPFPVHHHLLEFAQTHVHWVSDAIQSNLLCPPLLLLPSIFPSIRVCSNELALHFRWPKYWRFSFSISPSNECSGLISFRIDWFDTSFLHGACLRHLCSLSFNFKNHKKKNPVDLEVVSHPHGLGCRIVSPM